MKITGFFLLILICLPAIAFAVDGKTEITVDGAHLKNITAVVKTAEDAVTIRYDGHIWQIRISKLPKWFLEDWGISSSNHISSDAKDKEPEILKPAFPDDIIDPEAFIVGNVLANAYPDLKHYYPDIDFASTNGFQSGAATVYYLRVSDVSSSYNEKKGALIVFMLTHSMQKNDIRISTNSVYEGQFFKTGRQSLYPVSIYRQADCYLTPSNISLLHAQFFDIYAGSIFYKAVDLKLSEQEAKLLSSNLMVVLAIDSLNMRASSLGITHKIANKGESADTDILAMKLAARFRGLFIYDPTNGRILYAYAWPQQDFAEKVGL